MEDEDEDGGEDEDEDGGEDGGEDEGEDGGEDEDEDEDGDGDEDGDEDEGEDGEMRAFSNTPWVAIWIAKAGRIREPASRYPRLNRLPQEA